ncbi:MAG: type III-B CRISPR module RAMP protein Cmr6 [Peptococcaceae bacterium]|nr:MAG: type III-B CRISPR module RAMP protein Cmr6 [Peptococcaceae bacterium]
MSKMEEWKKKLADKYNRSVEKSKIQKPEKVLDSKQKEENIIRWILPLYQGLYSEENIGFLGKWSAAHPGLVFTKYPFFWGKKKDTKKDAWEDDLPHGGNSAKYGYLKKFIEFYNKKEETFKELLEKHNYRRDILFKCIGAQIVDFKTSWRFVSGLGVAHPMETGFIFDPVVGVPYLPGPSVKGIVRAWAEEWQAEDKEEILHFFGSESKDEKAKKQNGAVIFFDAYPLDWPVLELDVMNVHYKDYYESSKGKFIPPADYLSPTPIFFLTVASGNKFRFALAPSSDGNNEDVEKAKDWLKQALNNIGAGGKTAVGYGYMD